MQHAINRILIGFSGMLVVLSVAWGQQPVPPAAGEPVPAARVDKWIQQLDADQFEVRHTATDNLVRAGEAAIEPLAEAMIDANLEVSTRGVFVLRELAICGTITTEEAATAQLQQLADNPTSAAGRLARETLSALADVRQTRALSQLRELGARISARRTVIGPQQLRFASISIDEAWRGSVEDLQRLKWLRDVQQMELTGDQVTDAWLSAVQQLEGLQQLKIKHARITNAGLQALAEMKQLQALDLMYTPLTDACLPHLQAAKSLRVIRLYGTEITPTGLERLQLALAQAEIDYKQGAFLGVRCQQPPGPCQVMDVVADSGAKRAGIAPQDIIVGYDGKPIADFEDLRKLIAMNKVGDTVEVEVARGGQLQRARLSWADQEQLGVEGQDHPLGCRITKVLDSSAEAGAGLRVGDFLVELDDRPVRSLALLKQAFAQRKPNTPVGIQFLRGVEIVPLEVTFGEWQEE